MQTPPQIPLFVPDRFDMLQRRAPNLLGNIVVSVDSALEQIKNMSRDMNAAGRGGFLILRGMSGSGKSTFLNTVHLFVTGVEIHSVDRKTTLDSAFRQVVASESRLRVVIIEGRDALREISASEMETAIHEINSFLRSAAGERTLVVWPVNTEDLETLLIETSRRVGGDALLGVGKPSFAFEGPPPQQFQDIAQRTIATLNQGAALVDLGVSESRAQDLTKEAQTIGQYLGLLRQDLVRNQSHVEDLLDKERCRLWLVVAAGNDPEGDVAGVTRGPTFNADIDRLVSATKANIVAELKKYPDKLGILAAVLDAKVLYLPSVTALALCREFGDAKLLMQMAAKSLSTRKDKDTLDRLNKSDLAIAFSGTAMTTKSAGAKRGSNTAQAFKKLTEIAANDDRLLNSAIVEGLRKAGLITSARMEVNLVPD